jgi:hypothetical protein
MAVRHMEEMRSMSFLYVMVDNGEDEVCTVLYKCAPQLIPENPTFFSTPI